MSSPAVTPKRLARDIGLTRRDGSYVDSQFRQQQVEIAGSLPRDRPCLQFGRGQLYA